MRLEVTRRIETPCPMCKGAGGIVYASGATWRGGMGTASMEYDVCDQCWGSGDVANPWTDLRKLEKDRDERIKAEAATLLMRASGAQYWTMAADVLRLSDHIAAYARKRDIGFTMDSVALHLARMIREGVEAAQKREADAKEPRP